MATHIDAPRHFLPAGRTIEQISLTEVSGSTVCWSITVPGAVEITARDLEAARPLARPGDMVFIETGWGKLFNTPDYRIHPYLSLDAAEWLIAQRITLVGVDTQTPERPIAERPKEFSWPVHHRLLAADVLIAENLANLDQVANRRFDAYALPIPLAGSDGAPARIVAQV